MVPGRLLNPAPVAYFVGIIVTLTGAAMLLPAVVDLFAGNRDWQVLLLCASITGFFGGSVTLAARGTGLNLGLRETFLAVPLSWVSVAFFGGLPFVFSELDLSLTDALFESMSGLTATGSTVVVGLDGAAPGMQLWRFLLVWF